MIGARSRRALDAMGDGHTAVGTTTDPVVAATLASGYQSRMERAPVLRELLDAPLGRYLVGPSSLYFCAHRELFGFMLWGRPSGDDMEALTHALAVELGDAIAPHRSFIDASRLEIADAAAFEVLQRYVQKNRERLREVVTKLALVRPNGIAGAVVSGFYRVLDPPYPFEVFATAEEAIAWLGPPANVALVAELEAHYTEATGVARIVDVLRAVLEKALDASIEEAAKKVGVSRRTLQRRLHEAGTSFQEELSRARVREAERLLLTSDAPITQIAIDVGIGSLQHFSTLFRRINGDSPSEWRTKRRG